MKNIDLIYKYFENTLSNKELLIFNDLLESDALFKREFIFQKDLKKAIASNQKDTLKTLLQGFEEKFRNQKNVFFLQKKWLLAASIILLIGVGFWWNTTSSLTTKQLYAQNFEPYRNIVQPVVRGSSSNTFKYKAFVAYENKEYNKAIDLFNLVENSNEEGIQFYKAMSYLSLNKSAKAIALLTPITTLNKKARFSEMANWYLALAYLNNGENKKAMDNFSLIANNSEDVFKKEEAKRMVKSLN